MLRNAIRLGLAGSVLLLTSCGAATYGTSSGGGKYGAAVAITARDFGFQPATVTWTPGETIKLTFTNTGKVEHSFTPDGGLPEVEADGGSSRSITLTAPQRGPLLFHCKYHPTTMRGSIVISATGAAAGTSSGGDTGAPAGGYGN